MSDTTAAAATAGTTDTPVRVITSWELGTSEHAHDLFMAEPVRGRIFRRLDQQMAHAGTVTHRTDGRYDAWHSNDGNLGAFDTDDQARIAVERHAVEDRGRMIASLVSGTDRAWARDFCAMTGYHPPTAAARATRWGFRVERPRGADDPSELWTMSRGTRRPATTADELAVTAACLADELAVTTRAGHSYAGPMTVTVWEHDNQTNDAVHLYGVGIDSRTLPLPHQVVEDRSDPDATDADRLRWIAQTLGPCPVRDPATDEHMRPLRFVGGPWHGQTKYQAKAFWPLQARFVWTQDGVEHTVSAPERDGDPRGRYQPASTRDALMLWHIPGAPDPGQLVLTQGDPDPYELLALAAIHERARESADIAAAYGIDDSLEHGVNSSASAFVAAALHKLTAILPGITEDQAGWLDETAAALDLSVIENLTGANGTGLEGETSA